MRIKSKVGQSIAAQLTNIIQEALPQCIHSGISSHLGNIKPDPKGKAILFTWKKSIYGFRLTENLKAYEMDFTGTFAITDECKAIEAAIEKSLNPVVAEVEHTKVAVVEPASSPAPEMVAPAQTEVATL